MKVTIILDEKELKESINGAIKEYLKEAGIFAYIDKEIKKAIKQNT